ncbi:hypothetical protein [Tenacibaculum agarivorans]|uniref:hypothetical protein n=1 Tax=Tenacibaculum agarivorans TaxID=1908389 RepID=UPI000A4FD6DB|nr:hypothetical protein [Tenacibaculum agarivorans]
MIKKLIQPMLIVAIIVATVSSCRKDFSTVPSFGNLEFSKDTVFLDTIFTNIGSATYNLRVYNRSDKAITIPEIKLENGITSNYRLNVDGIPGKQFEDIEILAKDSIFVFVETTIDFDAISDPLYTDRILFDNGDNQQDVDLVTLVRNANFIFPGRTPSTMEIDNLFLDGQLTNLQGRFLTDSELRFTKEKPYVIYGFAAVPANKTLTIEAGATIHFHNNSGLIVDNGGTLKVNGTLEEKVVFQGDRLQDAFSRVSGQWGTIWMRSGSVENEINHAQIKNGVVGLLVDGDIESSTEPTLRLKNTEVYNQTAFGVLGRQAWIEGENVVIGNAGQVCFGGTVGGSYHFTHSTFANYWNRSLRTLPAVLINNFLTTTDDDGNETTITRNLLAANFTNCIIEGNNNIEFVLDRLPDGSTFEYNLKNCLIQFDDFNDSFKNNAELNFSDATRYENIFLNKNPDFKDVSKEEFIIGENSDAIGQGRVTPVTSDILGVMRSATPDLGAYQHITFN